MKKNTTIIFIMSIIIVFLGGITCYYYQQYNNLFNDYSPVLIRGHNINPQNTNSQGENKLINGSNDILLINIDDFKNNNFEFNIITGYVIITTELVRNEKIITGLGSSIISTIQHYGTRSDGTESVNEDKKCLIINGEAKEECEYLSWESNQWQEYMEFKEYKPGDQILISIREMLPYGNSEYSWSIEEIN